MILPAVDVGLMDEHLATHEGVLSKLDYYHHEVASPSLKRIIGQQRKIMQNHVTVMLSLLDPNQNQWVHLTPIEESASTQQHQGKMNLHDKPIALEAKATAKSMASDNFMSALMMKNPNVKHIHYEMAIQQATLEREYGEFIKMMGWEHPPMATEQSQLEIIQKFQHLTK